MAGVIPDKPPNGKKGCPSAELRVVLPQRSGPRYVYSRSDDTAALAAMLKKLSLLVISVIATCVACEVAIRHRSNAWPFERPLQVPEYLGERDATLRWRFSPANGRNSLGLRNREVGPKSSGTVRILFLGDSLIWTGETSSGPLYTEVLERRFNTRFAQARGAIEHRRVGYFRRLSDFETDGRQGAIIKSRRRPRPAR
jgi:hypothetical protein